MGSRRVLGNDPFQRGAAERTPATSPASDTPAAPEEAAARRAASAVAEQPSAGTRRGTGASTERAAGPAAKRPSPSRGPAPRPRKSPPGPASGEPAVASTPPPPPVPLAPPPSAEAAIGSLGGVDPGAPILTWTPAEAPPRELDRAAEGTEAAVAPFTASLVEVLREAPGVLAEAWAALEAALRAIRAGLGTAGGEQLDVYGRDARLSEVVAPLLDFLYSRWFRVEVEGASNVPAGGALLVANHAGALPLDGPMLHEALRRERPELPEARWLAEDQVFYAPLLGTLFNRLGAVRASPDSATRLLAEGRPVLIFPEGIQGIGKPFRDRYRLQRFGRGGFVKLALRTRRPILPVAIMGAEETLPLLGKLPGGLLGVPYLPVTPLGPLPLPAKWRIRIGEPITVPPGATETDLSVVESLVDATRNTIEHMLRALLGARGGVFLG